MIKPVRPRSNLSTARSISASVAGSRRDEASSRLDPATEALIERAVDKLLRGRTGLIIAHRLPTAQRADEIMILEHGAIREHGRRELLALNPDSRFYQLLQTGLHEVLA